MIGDDLDHFVRFRIARMQRIYPHAEGLLPFRMRSNCAFDLVGEQHREVFPAREVVIAVVQLLADVGQPVVGRLEARLQVGARREATARPCNEDRPHGLLGRLALNHLLPPEDAAATIVQQALSQNGDAGRLGHLVEALRRIDPERKISVDLLSSELAGQDQARAQTAERIIDAEIARFERWLGTLEVRPTVAALHLARLERSLAAAGIRSIRIIVPPGEASKSFATLERVVDAIPDIGYLHSGFEKLGEHLDYNQYVTIVSRMNYLSPIANDICWHHAVEKLFGIDITPRCKVLRTIMAELARIQDHLLCVGAAALDLGAFTGFLYTFNPREKIYDICDYIAGQRYHPDWTRVGGAMQDLPDEETFQRLVKDFIHKDLPQSVKDLEVLVERNRIFQDRTRGIGVIDRNDAVAWSLSGPMARASGVERDLRKDFPYLCYADNWDGQGAEAVQFQVPVATDGDVYARFLVRIEEIRQSIRIIDQLIDNIPGGPIDTFADGKMVKPPKADVYGSIEGLMNHFMLIMEGFGIRPPRGEAYVPVEGANGELGFYVVSDGTDRPYRVRCRPPCLPPLAALHRMIEVDMIADLIPTFGSVNMIGGELDR